MKIICRLMLLLLLAACSRQSAPPAPDPAVEARYAEVLRAVSSGDYDGAITICQEIIAQAPNFPKPYRKIADIARLQEEFSGPRTIFQALIGQQPENGYSYYGLGLVEYYAGNYSQAVDAFKSSIQLRPDYPDAYGYRGLVDAYVKLDELPGALNYFQQRLTADPNNANIHYGIGYTLRKQKEYAAALTSLETACELDNYHWQALRSIGLVYYFQGNYKKALKYWEREEKVDDRIGNLEAQGQVIGNIGALLIGLGDYPRALLFTQKALVLDRRTGNLDGEEKRTANIGSIYLDLGDYQRALTYYQQALGLSQRLADQEREANNLINLGNVNLYLNNYARMDSSWQQARQIFNALGNTNEEIHTISNIAFSYNLRENYQQASALLDTALSFSNATTNPGVLGDLRNNLGTANLRLQQLPAALENFKLGLKLGKQIREPAIIWEALAGIAAVREAEGNPKEALKQYKKAIDTIEKVRETLGTEAFKSGYLKDKIHIYEKTIRLQKELHGLYPGDGYDRDAFHYAERAKARAFLDLLAEAETEIAEGVDPALLEKEYVIYETIATLQASFQEASSDSQVAKLEAKLQDAQAELTALKAEMHLKNPRYADLKYPQPVSVKQVQEKLLQDDNAFLQYVLGDSSSFLFVVTKEDFQIFDLPGRAELNESVTLFRSMLLNPGRFSFRIFSSRANKLYRLLIAPAQEMLAGKETLILSPDGILHYLPFDVLITKRAARGSSLAANFQGDLSYLVRERALCYGPSATVLVQLQENPTAQATAAYMAYGDPVFGDTTHTSGDAVRNINGGDALRVVADEQVLRYVTGAPDLRTFRNSIYRLPNTRTEVVNISRRYADSGTRIYTGSDASEENVKHNDALANYRYLHFATHGLLNEKKPQYSGLVMTLDDDTGEDGFLQMNEIFNLRLNARMVVLSACQTGLGKLVRGEGVIGLTRAFMYAGSPSVVVTLWNVADRSTSVFMQQFYQHLDDNPADGAAALRQAKLDMLNDAKYQHPFYWAPFSMVGN